MSKHVSLFRSFALAAALVVGSGAAFAQQAAPAPAPADGPTVEQVMKTPFLPSHIAAATEVLKASGMMTMFENSLPNVIGALRVNVTRQRPELAKDIEEALKLVEKETGAVMSDGLNGASRFLAIRMTEAELKDVVTFLSSPAGKKYVGVLPGFMDQVVPYLQVWNQEASGRMMKVFQEEMTKRGHKL